MEITKDKVQDASTVLSSEDMAIVYGCLNGKGNSCIKGREISADKIKCALSKVFSNNGHIIKSRLTTLMKANPLDEYIQRARIVDYIKNKYHIEFPFEQVQGFKEGARVRIRKSSQYRGQSDGEGFLMKDFNLKDKENYQSVLFVNGYVNSYRIKDLKLVSPQIKTSSPEDILSATKQKSREEFVSEMVSYIYPKIQENPELIKNFNHLKDTVDELPSFEMGDEIVMNDSADGVYSYTTSGSLGEVIENTGRGDYRVLFSYLAANGEGGINYKVNAKYMDKVNPFPEGVTEDALRKIVEKKLDHRIESSGVVESHFQRIGSDKLIENGVLLPIDDANYALNFSEISKFVAPQLHSIYSNPELYSTSVMFEPPAERLPNVLRLQLTDGCNHNKCTFCNGFNGVNHSQKTSEEFIQHTDKVLAELGRYKREIDRVFLGSGNGLDVSQDTLEAGLSHILYKLDNIRRVAIYGTTKSINKKTPHELFELKRRGLSCIYRGAESGSDEVLKYIRKGCTYDEMVHAGETVNEARIDLSAMIMPGLGGRRFYQQHIDGTVKLLNSVNWKYVTFMSINPAENSIYQRVMDREQEKGTNRPLTDVELVKQVLEIIGRLDTGSNKKVGMFGEEIDAVGKNPIVFHTEFDSRGKQAILAICDEYLETHKDIEHPEDVSIEEKKYVIPEIITVEKEIEENIPKSSEVSTVTSLEKNQQAQEEVTVMVLNHTIGAKFKKFIKDFILFH